MNKCTTCKHWAMRFMDDAGAWGQCRNDKALGLLFVSTTKIDDIPQEIREAIHKQARAARLDPVEALRHE